MFVGPSLGCHTKTLVVIGALRAISNQHLIYPAGVNANMLFDTITKPMRLGTAQHAKKSTNTKRKY